MILQSLWLVLSLQLLKYISRSGLTPLLYFAVGRVVEEQGVGDNINKYIGMKLGREREK